jgi:hypothetical protein
MAGLLAETRTRKLLNVKHDCKSLHYDGVFLFVFTQTQVRCQGHVEGRERCLISCFKMLLW